MLRDEPARCGKSDGAAGRLAERSLSEGSAVAEQPAGVLAQIAHRALREGAGAG
jgi:hypothetical protein